MCDACGECERCDGKYDKYLREHEFVSCVYQLKADSDRGLVKSFVQNEIHEDIFYTVVPYLRCSSANAIDVHALFLFVTAVQTYIYLWRPSDADALHLRMCGFNVMGYISRMVPASDDVILVARHVLEAPHIGGLLIRPLERLVVADFRNITSLDLSQCLHGRNAVTDYVTRISEFACAFIVPGSSDIRITRDVFDVVSPQFGV